MNPLLQRKRRLRHFTYSREITANPALVWDVVSDHAALVKWLPIQGSTVWPAASPRFPHGVGTVRALRFRRRILMERIVEHVPLTSVTFRLVSGLGDYRYVYTVDVRPSLSGCMLSTAAVVDLPAPLAALLVPIVIRLATRAAAREITRLSRATATRTQLADRVAFVTAVANQRVRRTAEGRVPTDGPFVAGAVSRTAP